MDSCHKEKSSSTELFWSIDAQQAFNESAFDDEVNRTWNDAVHTGVFNYTIDEVQFRRIPGKYNLLAELNISRSSKRRPPHGFTKLYEPFSATRFNYTLLKPEEILFEYKPRFCSNSSKTSACPDTKECESNNSSKHMIIINNSPIERGHILLVPSLSACLPQAITEESLMIAAQLCLSSSTIRFVCFYNTLLSFASVNHLHFHYWYMREDLSLQNWAAKHIKGDLFMLNDWYLPAFAFQLVKGTANWCEQDLQRFVGNLFKAVRVLQAMDIPHSLGILRARPFGGSAAAQTDASNEYLLSAFLFPKKPVYGAKTTSATFNPAAAEAAGHMLIYDESFFHTVNEQQILQNFEAVNVENTLYEQLYHELVNLF